MNPSLHSYPPLEQDANTLAYAAQLLCRGEGNQAVDDIFTTALTRTLSRGDPDESAVLQAAAHTLCARQDDEAYYWLLNEIEMECELQYLPDPVTGKLLACVLFAIPVVAPSDKKFPSSLYVNSAFESLHDILEDAQVFDTQASFRLLPNLFTAQDLRGRSKTSLRALTRSLGAQLLAERAPVLELPEDFHKEAPPELEDLSLYDYANLRYLVGITAVHQDFLQDLFPALTSPSTNQEGGGSDGQSAAPDAGWLPDGRWWAHPFHEKLADCFAWLEAEVSCCAPQGFHSDIRLGLELLREKDTGLKCGVVTSACSLTGASFVVEEWPLSTPDKQVVGIAVYLVDAEEPERVYGAISWPKFHHETLDDAIDLLHELLTDLELDPADELLSSDATTVSYLLH